MTNKSPTSSESFIKIMTLLVALDSVLQEFTTNNIWGLSISEYEQLNKKFESTVQNINFVNNSIAPIYQDRKSSCPDKTSE